MKMSFFPLVRQAPWGEFDLGGFSVTETVWQIATLVYTNIEIYHTDDSGDAHVADPYLAITRTRQAYKSDGQCSESKMSVASGSGW